MQVTINPGIIYGSITAPSSKSMTQRAYAAALLHKGTTIINNVGNSEDEKAALDIIKQLGATIENEVGNVNTTQTVKSNGITPISNSINCGESGLATRLFTPIAALSNQPIRIEGKGSLLQRPMNDFKEILPLLNVSLSKFDGCVPFTVQGPIKPGNIKINASGSSQFLSGLLFALSDCAKETITIEVTELNSKPYIDLTLEILEHFGKPILRNNYKEFFINPVDFHDSENIEVNIEGDWSGAAFMLVAGAISGSVTIQNLKIDSKQADRAIMDVLQSAGADIIQNNGNIIVTRSQLNGFDFDATDCPDLFPVLSVLAACCKGESNIKGVHRIFHKESNRAESITEMLDCFDVPFSMEDDILRITGVKKLQGTVIDSYNDHRIVMAASIGALRAGSRVDITRAEAVNKSYPNFFSDLKHCGVNIEGGF